MTTILEVSWNELLHHTDTNDRSMTTILEVSWVSGGRSFIIHKIKIQTKQKGKQHKAKQQTATDL
jgi:hypothetical protein